MKKLQNNKQPEKANSISDKDEHPKIGRKNSSVPHLFPETPKEITHTHDDDTDSEESNE